MQIVQSLAVCVLIAIAGAAHADLGIEHSRLIYPAGESSVALRLWNKGERSSLVQSWIDVGDRSAKPETLRAPLMATPPVFRLNPGQNRDLLVRGVSEQSLPQDRESLLWLNVLDVPARAAVTAAGADPEYAVSWRLKVFYRPLGLTGTAEEAANALSWRWVSDQQGTVHLRADNTSAFHVSLGGLSLGDVPLPLTPDRAVIAPRSTWSLALAQSVVPDGELRIRWMDDRGKAQERVVLPVR